MTRPFTVIELIRELGCEPEAPLSWSVGAAVRDAYWIATGELPVKELRPKTDGAGTHCFAVYPAEFKEKARELVARLLAETVAARRAQPGLF